MSDEQIRQWILSDETLYLLAQGAGMAAYPRMEKGDEAMYKHLPKFIRTRRPELVEYIQARLATPAAR